VKKRISLVILTGGKGSRIKKFIKKPKPLSEFQKKNFFQLLLNHFSKFNIFEIIILAGYKGKYFKKYDNLIINSVKIKVVIENIPLGTAGSLSQLKKKIKNDFILVNGDTICFVDLNKFIKSSKNKMIHMALVKNNNYKSNNILVGLGLTKNNIIKNSQRSNYMSAGILLIKKSFLKKISKKFLSLEKDFLPNLIKRGQVSGIYVQDFFLDIGTPENYKFAKKNLKKFLIKKGVFLDRDGVINEDYGYIHKMKDFHFRTGVIKGLKFLIKKNYSIFIVTNQAGIAKNKFSLKKYLKFSKQLKEEFEKKEIYFDSVEFCPYHPGAKIAKYRKKSIYRKPGNGMIKKILKNFYVEKSKSFMLGDKKSDMLAAKKSRIKFYFVKSDFYRQLKKIVN